MRTLRQGMDDDFKTRMRNTSGLQPVFTSEAPTLVKLLHHYRTMHICVLIHVAGYINYGVRLPPYGYDPQMLELPVEREDQQSKI
jgi:hypothetical protein